jgi:flagellar basal body P-ring formation protein FlgA
MCLQIGSTTMLKPAAIGLIFLASPAYSQAFEDVEALRSVVSTQTGVHAAAITIDERLKLKKCPETPLIEAPVMGAVAVRCPSLGWRIRVPIAALESSRAASLPLVRRGDIVEVVAVGQGYSVSSSGTAMEEGAKGTAVRVKTGNASAPVTATVLDVGRVVINN